MDIQTAQFGTVKIDEDHLIVFDQGIPGFEDYRTFALFSPNEDIPFSFLQSVEHVAVSFILVDPFLFYPDYEFQLNSDAIEQLEVHSQQELSIWSILSLGESIATSTINLLAPVIINTARKKGGQVVLHGSGYKTKHPIRTGKSGSVKSTVVKENANAGFDS